MNFKEFREKGNLLIGATGAIDVVNLPWYIGYLKTNICKNIRVILTDTACKFVSKEALSNISGNSVFTTDYFDKDFPAPHITLTEWADFFIILPTSANLIGKVANGIADDLLSTSILAANCPVMFLPSTNKQMWDKPVMKRNIDLLINDGYHLQFTTGKVLKVSTGTNERTIKPNIENIEFEIKRILEKEGS